MAVSRLSEICSKQRTRGDVVKSKKEGLAVLFGETQIALDGET